MRLKYDAVKDEVMIPNYKTNTIIVLNKERVSRFSLLYQGVRHEFVRVRAGDPRVDGYVQLLYDGNVRLYEKWKKRIIVNQSRLSSEFSQEGTLYLHHESKIHKISNRNQLLSIFKERKKSTL